MLLFKNYLIYINTYYQKHKSVYAHRNNDKIVVKLLFYFNINEFKNFFVEKISHIFFNIVTFFSIAPKKFEILHIFFY